MEDVAGLEVPLGSSGTGFSGGDLTFFTTYVGHSVASDARGGRRETKMEV